MVCQSTDLACLRLNSPLGGSGAAVHADICDLPNPSAVERFRSVLRSLSAEALDYHESALGVDLWRFRVGEATLSVFIDSWSLDVEGPTGLVERIVSALRSGDAA